MKNLSCACVFAFSILMLPSAFACEAPTPIEIPNGAEATEEEMNTAGTRLHEFMIASQLYQACLEDEAQRARQQSPDSDAAEIRATENRFAERHNAASAAMKRAAEAFERAVAEFRRNQ